MGCRGDDSYGRLGRQVVRKAIPSEQACDELIELIKENGRWVEPAKDEEPEPAAV